MGHDEQHDDDDMDSYEHDPVDDDDSLSAALAAEWGSAPWYVSSIGVHLVLFLILFLIPITPPDEPEPALELTTQIVEEEEEEEEEEKPEVEVVEKEKVDQEITETPVEVPEITEVNIEITDHMETEDEVEDNTAAGDPDNMATFDSEFTGTPALMGVGASGGGGGGGRFGNRGRGGRKKAVMRGGGSKKTESAVNWALEWLAEHQESDGSWDSSKYGGSKGKQGPDDLHDIAVTGLAMLAFLGAGNSVGFGKYKGNVRRATEWMIAKHKQRPGKSIGYHNYTGGIALMAIAEAYGMSEGHPMAKEIGIVAQQCVDWAVKSQNGSGGYDYSPNSARDDESVTGWWIMGLKSAYVAGLNVPDKAFKQAKKFIRDFTNEEGKGGYSAPFKGSIRMSAVSNTCLQFLGDPRANRKVIGTAEASTVDWAMPAARMKKDKKDFYLMYYQALGLFQMGIKSKYWVKFNGQMKLQLLSTQIRAGTFKQNKGSWDPVNDHLGERWGRVGQTALGALMLEVYYRYKQGAKVGKRH